MRVVLATGNLGKLREFADLLGPAGLEFQPLSAFGVESPEETGLTFVDNALLKARHAAARTGLPAMADDSGLEVDALGGAPGVRSARYAAPPGSDASPGDAANVDKLLRELHGVAPARRTARWRRRASMRGRTSPTPATCRRPMARRRSTSIPRVTPSGLRASAGSTGRRSTPTGFRGLARRNSTARSRC